MSYSPEDLLEIARKIRMDLTNAQGKLSDLMTGIAQVTQGLSDGGAKFICPRCTVEHRTAERMAEHMANVHGEGEPVREVA